ncbi:unnamed protein product [Merluccius merluccius]
MVINTFFPTAPLYPLPVPFICSIWSVIINYINSSDAVKPTNPAVRTTGEEAAALHGALVVWLASQQSLVVWFCTGDRAAAAAASCPWPGYVSEGKN